MADGRITFSTDFDNKELEKQLNEVTKKVESSEKKWHALEKKRAAADAKVSEKTETQSSLKAEYESASKEAKKTETIISDLQAQMAQYESIQDEFGIKNPVGMSETEAKLKNQEAILARQDKEVESLHAKYAKVTEELKRANEVARSLNLECEDAKEKTLVMKAQATEISEQIEMASRNQNAFGDAVTGSVSGISGSVSGLSGSLSTGIKVGSKTLPTYIDEIVANKITANYISAKLGLLQTFQLNGHAVEELWIKDGDGNRVCVLATQS